MDLTPASPPPTPEAGLRVTGARARALREAPLHNVEKQCDFPKGTEKTEKKRKGKKALSMTVDAVRMRKLITGRGGSAVHNALLRGKAIDRTSVSAARRNNKPLVVRAMMFKAQEIANAQLQIVLYALAAICSCGTFFLPCWAALIISGQKTKELRNHKCGYIGTRRLVITKDSEGRGRLALGVIVFKKSTLSEGGWTTAGGVVGACVDEVTAASLVAQRLKNKKKLPDMWVWEIDCAQTEVFEMPVALPNDGSQVIDCTPCPAAPTHAVTRLRFAPAHFHVSHASPP
jgi:hypothetical protein